MRCLIISDTTTHSKYWYYKYVQLLGGRKHTFAPPPLFILGGRRPSSPPAFYASGNVVTGSNTSVDNQYSHLYVQNSIDHRNPTYHHTMKYVIKYVQDVIYNVTLCCFIPILLNFEWT